MGNGEGREKEKQSASQQVATPATAVRPVAAAAVSCFPSAAAVSSEQKKEDSEKSDSLLNQSQGIVRRWDTGDDLCLFVSVFSYRVPRVTVDYGSRSVSPPDPHLIF